MKTILRNSLPGILGIAAIQLNFLIDLFWISRVDELLIAGIAIFLGIFWIFDSWASLVDGGALTLISQNHGAKNHDKTKNQIITCLLLDGVLGAVMAISGMLALSPLLKFIANDSSLYITGHQYGRIVIWTLLCTPIITTVVTTLRCTDRPRAAMYLLFFIAAINMILDPILIFGLLGVPKLGLDGAAIATLVSSISGTIAGVMALFLMESKVKLKLELINHIKWENAKEIFKPGLPAAIFSFIVNFTFFVIVSLGNTFGATVIAVLGVNIRIIMFLTIVARGYAMGIGAVIGNFIGQRKQTTRRLIGVSTIIIFIVNGFLAFCLFVLSKTTSHIFFSIQESINLAVNFNQIMAGYFFFIGNTLYIQLVLLYMGHGKTVFKLAMFANLIFMIPILTGSVLVFKISAISFCKTLLVVEMVLFCCYLILLWRKTLTNEKIFANGNVNEKTN